MIYDKDKNNEPTTRYDGEKAHWLMITGFCYRPIRSNKPGVLTSSPLGNVISQPTNSYSKSRGENLGFLSPFFKYGEYSLNY